MKAYIAVLFSLVVAVASGCADLGSLGGTEYGETSGTVTNQQERAGYISSIETIEVDESYKFGIGTVVGAVAGGLLGSQVGGGSGTTVATVAGAAAGAAAGTYAESRMSKVDAQRVSVQMNSGGQVIIMQPLDSRLSDGMRVRVEGSGENGRVVPL